MSYLYVLYYSFIPKTAIHGRRGSAATAVALSMFMLTMVSLLILIQYIDLHPVSFLFMLIIPCYTNHYVLKPKRYRRSLRYYNKWNSLMLRILGVLVFIGSFVIPFVMLHLFSQR